MGIDRRAVLAGLASAPLCAARAEPASVPWSNGSEPSNEPRLVHLTDCHHHIFDSRFPLAPGMKSVHPDATAQDYLKLAQRLGIARNVAIQPSNYGTDNSCLLDALKTFGPSARGIAVVDTSVTDDELDRLLPRGALPLLCLPTCPAR
jgi:D-galactarolactone isomerase